MDYCSTYSGIIPAEDCPGINVTLSANEDKTFYLVYGYIDGDSKFEAKGIYPVKGNYIIRGKLEDKFILNKKSTSGDDYFTVDTGC